MAIVKIQGPDEVSLSKNPIPLILESDNWQISPGTKASWLVRVNSGPPSGAKLSLEFAGVELELDFVSLPDGSGVQVSAYPGGPLDEYTALLVDQLNSNYLLSTTYLISYYGILSGDPAFLLSAREQGAFYTLSWNTLPSGFIQVSNLSGADPVYNSNFRIKIELQEGDGAFDTFLSESRTPDPEGRVEVDLAEVIDGRLAIDLPSFSTGALQAERVIKPFRLRYAESFGDPELVQRVYTSSVFNVLQGGIAPEQFPGFEFWNAFQPAERKFLSWYPGVKKVPRDQPEWLYHLTRINGNWEVKIELFFSNGTSQTNGVYSTFGSQRGEVWSMPVGYEQLNLDQYGSGITRWDVWVETANGQDISERRSYELDGHNWPHPRLFLCQNSLGGVEVIRTQGEQEFFLNTKGTSIERILPMGYKVSDGQFTPLREPANTTFKVNTGFLRKDEAIYLQELLLSDNVFLIDPPNFIPINLVPGRTKILDDGIDLHFLEFEYALGYSSKVFTPKL